MGLGRKDGAVTHLRAVGTAQPALALLQRCGVVCFLELTLMLNPAVCRSSPQNLIAQSQSGTGKTAAFVLAMLSRVEPGNKYPQVGCSTGEPFCGEFGVVR